MECKLIMSNTRITHELIDSSRREPQQFIAYSGLPWPSIIDPLIPTHIEPCIFNTASARNQKEQCRIQPDLLPHAQFYFLCRF